MKHTRDMAPPGLASTGSKTKQPASPTPQPWLDLEEKVKEKILVQIFARLPVKSICRCRCLSRSSAAMLASPSFLDLHRQQASQSARPRLFFLHEESSKLNTPQLAEPIKQVRQHEMDSMKRTRGTVVPPQPASSTSGPAERSKDKQNASPTATSPWTLTLEEKDKEMVLVQIFARLPVETICRCRCLSRSWAANFSSASFLNLYFQCNPN